MKRGKKKKQKNAMPEGFDHDVISSGGNDDDFSGLDPKTASSSVPELAPPTTPQSPQPIIYMDGATRPNGAGPSRGAGASMWPSLDELQELQDMTEISWFKDPDEEKTSFDNPTYSETDLDEVEERQKQKEGEEEEARAEEEGESCFLDRRSMKRIGTGNFGTVYEATLIASGQRKSVAVKTIKSGELD